MRIIADAAIKLVEEAFGSLGEVVPLPAEDICSETVRDADILLVRTETRVNASLLAGSQVRFVATATTGEDHIDLDFLSSAGVGFANAAGCNANSVCEYILATLLTLGQRNQSSLRGKTLGIVGVGKIGSRVARVARALGMEVLENDPPLADETGNSNFLDLDALMSVDFLTIHVPLTRTGPHPTFHLFDGNRLKRMDRSTLLINSSRGSVIHGDALKQSLLTGQLSACVLDVWEDEPGIDLDLMDRIEIGTPHIAGYSLDGKLLATQMAYDAACDFLGLPSTWRPDVPDQRPAEAKELDLTSFSGPTEDAVYRAVTCCYDPLVDDRNLRSMHDVPEADRSTYFKSLRRQYPIRREFNNTTVRLRSDGTELSRVLETIGFRLDFISS